MFERGGRNKPEIDKEHVKELHAKIGGIAARLMVSRIIIYETIAEVIDRTRIFLAMVPMVLGLFAIASLSPGLAEPIGRHGPAYNVFVIGGPDGRAALARRSCLVDSLTEI